ncbi:dihydrofolate reductase family protein [Modestobacter sp. VKM Ac-2985]|uniref:dihydrofolate reductase family protein n=1 Tax=Modestobacter sp. VKM Ac-2985 TaxID=3004139 RepID=UPI0022ABC0C2|nr:dihydrofolate reductase family protein [Modestobacter sp. VKM Ac-2985]MCZ2839367.1 dihydrofolate reductase family protein [Modestobacter sp. VKM Ac-2985]
MRRVVAQMAVSLDGYFEGPDGDISWHRVDEELHAHFNEQLATMGAFLCGRVTYQLMEQYWPAADQDPTSSPTEAEFAGIWREMPKVVYSSSLTAPGPNATLVRDVVPDQVRALQAQPGGDMVLGGALLGAAFRQHDLIDEYRIYVNPVLLGAGRQLFGPGEKPRDLRLVETRTFGNGVVLLRHERPR